MNTYEDIVITSPCWYNSRQFEMIKFSRCEMTTSRDFKVNAFALLRTTSIFNLRLSKAGWRMPDGPEWCTIWAQNWIGPGVPNRRHDWWLVMMHVAPGNKWIPLVVAELRPDQRSIRGVSGTRLSHGEYGSGVFTSVCPLDAKSGVEPLGSNSSARQIRPRTLGRCCPTVVL